MIRGFALLAAIAAISSVPAQAQPVRGSIDTLDHGTYRCELPGDAAGAAGIAQPERDFTILSGSRYKKGDSEGTYLLKGDRLIMTSGPLQGTIFERERRGFLREVGTKLRCIRS